MIHQFYTFASHASLPLSLVQAATMSGSSICDLVVSVLSKMDMHTSKKAMERLGETMREHNRLSKEMHIQRLRILSQRKHII